MVRVYKFKRAILRDNVNLLLFKDAIQEGFRSMRPDVRVNVFKDRYVVHGNITSRELRVIGRRICANPELGKLCKRYATSTQLFVCVNKGNR